MGIFSLIGSLLMMIWQFIVNGIQALISLLAMFVVFVAWFMDQSGQTKITILIGTTIVMYLLYIYGSSRD